MQVKKQQLDPCMEQDWQSNTSLFIVTLLI